MVKVSVLVPIYNVSDYLEVCLESLKMQDLQEMEIICINDGSTDDSSAIAHKYAEQDKRFLVIDKANSGYGKSMNLGLSKAQGEYIGIVESDDFVEPGMFSSLYAIAHDQKADVVKSAYWVHTNGHDAYNEAASVDLYDRVLSSEQSLAVFNWNPSIWSNLYRREFLEENNIRFLESPGASFQDVAWRVKVFACARRAVFTRKAFYHYRRDNVNASVRTDGKLFCVCDEYDEAERFLRQRGDWGSRYRYLLPYLRWGHYNWNCFDRWLSLGSRYKFYCRMVKEFIGFEEQKLLSREYWDKGSWLALQQMLCDSRQFFYNRYALFLQKAIVLQGFLPTLCGASRLAIYGAGQVGREALAALCLYSKAPDCFAVTSLEGNTETIENVPVRPIAELLPYKDQYVVLIAVAAAAQPEIVEHLLEQGFQHVVAFLPGIRQALR